MPSDVSARIEEVYRADWGKIVASLIKQLGDFELAEEAAQEAFTAAMQQWPNSGIPEVPTAWILRAAKNKAIDRLRHQTLHSEKLEQTVKYGFAKEGQGQEYEKNEIPTERSRLLITTD